jgi:transcriptional regulator of acetoin/glycerol metabolism
LASVGAMSHVHTSASINASEAHDSPRGARRHLALRETCQQMRMTHDGENRLQQYEWPENIERLQDVVESAAIL